MAKINEIYYSIQGESTFAGLPCVFVRFTYCNLRCTYCDTAYAFYEGRDASVDEIISEIKEYNCKLVEITGGEPLVQRDECLELMRKLCHFDYQVMIETGGSLPINGIDPRVKIIMDLKCPSSGMMKKNLYENIYFLKPIDEVKFVIGTKEDYDWAKEIIKQYELDKRCTLLFSPVFGSIEPSEIVHWILEDSLPVRFQLQMHKYIWNPEIRGV
uniref:7-carboxy-7-deazaguanine synthase n=1 Tax=Ignavibacterium album TaxID=591197 RepID=A0A832G2K7_9BACT